MTATCTQCQSTNREFAKYCKFCGYEIVSTNGTIKKELDFDELIGLTELKKEITEKITFAKGMRQSGRQFDKKQLHTILIGNTGTAKSKIADLLAKVYFKNGIISKPDSKTINAVDFTSFSKDLAVNLNAAKGGIVFIDEVHKLVPAEYVPGQTTPMDKLYVEMEKQNGDPVIILSSRPEGFNEYLEKNPEVKKRFNLIFKLPDLTAEEMYELAMEQFKKQKFTLEPNAEIKLQKLFRNIVKKKDSEFGNGHDVNKIVNEIIEQHILRPGNPNMFDIIYEAAIKGKIDEDKTTDQIFEELNQFIGMSDVKSYIRNMIDRIEVAKKDAEKTGKKYSFGEHLIFTGNPGTGKTILARKLGEIFSSIGLLTRGHVVEVDRSKLVSQFVDGTGELVQKKCNEAIGGILLIDEAYTLINKDGEDKNGQQAIDTLLKRMEDDRGSLMVIAAGYEKDMQRFINANPGLKSRFKEENIFNLKDYAPNELYKIFKKFVEEENYFLDINAELKLQDTLKVMYEKRDKNFGNGRDVRNLYDKCKGLRAMRLSKTIEDNHDLILYADDIPAYEDDRNAITLEDSMNELNKLIGVASVKKEIADLINLINIQKRRSQGNNLALVSQHFIFKGNPGTGKTTVARILANIFKAMNLLPKGQLIEVSSEGLIVGYVRQTGEKTNKVIDSAIGGLLFIDEAYGLVDGGANDFGKEAITALLQRLENDRGKFITIVAGYNKDMDRFLQSNPGLPSRFTKTIYFEDYTPDEMILIFKKMVADISMKLDENMDEFLQIYFTTLYDNRDSYFANGRTVRNILEKQVMKNQATRITELENRGINVDEMINKITQEDFK